MSPVAAFREPTPGRPPLIPANGTSVRLACCARSVASPTDRPPPAGPSLTVDQVGENCADLLGVPAADLLGTAVTDWVDPGQRDTLRRALSADDLRPLNPLRVTVALAGRPFDGLAQRHDGVLVLELDRPRPAGAAARRPTTRGRSSGR